MKIEDVCDYLIVKAAESGMFINLMKLHKLVYYSEAWWLARKAQGLTGMRFQAWVHGPVNLEISARFRDRRKSFYLNLDRKDTAPDFDTESIPADVREHLDRILELYIGFTGNQLEEIVCSEQPWIAARGAYAPTYRCDDTAIDPGVMQQYYLGMLVAKTGEIPAVDQRYTR